MTFDDLPEQVRAEIVRAISAQKKLDAVKLYKDASGSSLLEAKTAVESLEAEILERDLGSTDEKIPEMTGHPRDEIIDAVIRGKKLDAVKLYKESAGVSLREAKEFIEDLTEKMRQENPGQFREGKSGCLGLLSIACTIGFLLVHVLTQI